MHGVHASLIPELGAKTPHASGKKKKEHKKQKLYCNKFSKDFRNGLHKKKSLKYAESYKYVSEYGRVFTP